MEGAMRRPALAARIVRDWRSGDRAGLARCLIAVLAVLAAATFMTSITTGAADASLSSIFRWLSGETDQAMSARDRIIILDIRLPRAVLGMLVGASLAVSGVVMQG
ncbi:iron ABC transporter, partial [Sinorhizobium meliloti]